MKKKPKLLDIQIHYDNNTLRLYNPTWPIWFLVIDPKTFKVKEKNKRIQGGFVEYIYTANDELRMWIRSLNFQADWPVLRQTLIKEFILEDSGFMLETNPITRIYENVST